MARILKIYGDLPKRPELASITLYYRIKPELKDFYLEALRAHVLSEVTPHTSYLVFNSADEFTERTVLEELERIYREAPEGKSTVVMRSETNLGFARGNMLAYEFMKRVQRPFALALVNDDMIVSKGVMSLFVKVLKEFGWVSGVGGVMRWPDGDVFTYNFLLTVDFVAQYFKLYGIKPGFPTYLSGAFSVYKFEDLEECGGLFSKDLPFMYTDDVELGVRLWRCGKRIVTIPVEVGTHYGSASTGKVKKMFKLKPLYAVSAGRGFGKVILGRYLLSDTLRIIAFLNNLQYSAMYSMKLDYNKFLEYFSRFLGMLEEHPLGRSSEPRLPELFHAALYWLRIIRNKRSGVW